MIRSATASRPTSCCSAGHDLLKKRHYAAAAIVLERAARQEPGKGSILEALGRALYNSGQHEGSRETFAALLEIDPSAHYAHYALGQSLKQLGRIKRPGRISAWPSPDSKLYSGALARLGAAPERADPPPRSSVRTGRSVPTGEERPEIGRSHRSPFGPAGGPSEGRHETSRSPLVRLGPVPPKPIRRAWRRIPSAARSAATRPAA